MRYFGPAILALVLLASPGQAQFFTENWDDGAGNTRWSDPLFALESTNLAFEGSVNYAFDYSVLGAPSAPNSTGGTTTGVFMETNTIDSSGPEGEAVGILPNGFTLPNGDYMLTADVYIFWNGGSGSTEYATLGVHHSGSDRVPLRVSSGVNTGDGLAWSVDSDGDALAGDVIQYLNFEGAGAQTFLDSYQEIPDGTIPGVPTGDADPVGPFNQWVELSVTRIGNTIEFAMNGFVLDSSFDEGTVSSFTGGTILLSQMDPFDSVNVDDGSGLSNGVVFDNIVVAEPVIAPVLAGDYNDDGVVDAADYTRWRDNLNAPAGTLPNDTDGGSIGNAQLLTWQGAYGDTLGGTSSLEIPEPGSLSLVGLLTLAAARRGRR